MSYILDALRRAEAERQRGAVPGLHAPGGLAGLADAGAAPPTAPRRLGGWLIGGAAALLLAVLLAAWLMRPAPPAASMVAAPAASALRPVPPPSLQAPTLQPPSVPPPSPAWPAMPAPAPPLPAPQRPLPPPKPVVAEPGAASPASEAVPTRLPTLAELPDALRRELPSLTVGGAVYAEQPALRIVILNGQVFHEGDRVAPELLVLQIRLKSVVMSLRGQRFELPL